MPKKFKMEVVTRKKVAIGQKILAVTGVVAALAVGGFFLMARAVGIMNLL